MSDDQHDASATSPRWLHDIEEATEAVRELAQAQWHLLGTELRLVRSAALTLLVVMLLAVVFASSLGLALLALLGLLLSQWLGSWIWALLVLAGLLVLGLGASMILGRRCLHWLSLPGTRARLRRFAQPPATATSAAEPPPSDTETSTNDHTRQTG